MTLEDDTGTIAKVTNNLPPAEATKGRPIAKDLEFDMIEDGVEIRIDLDPEGV